MPESSLPQHLPPSPLLGDRTDVVYRSLLETLHLPGDVAECGAHECATAVAMVSLIREREPAKTVHAFDTFEGLPDVITDEERSVSTWPDLAAGHYAADAAALARNTGSVTGLELHRGLFETTFPAFGTPLCFIHSDSDLYTSTRQTIALAERLLVPGGVVIVDDYGNPRLPGVALAVDRALPGTGLVGERIRGTIQFRARRA